MSLARRLALVSVVALVATSAQADPPRKPAAPAKSTPKPCDANELEKRAIEQAQTGNTQVAFMGFEAAIQCKPSEQLYFRAVITGCKLYTQGRRDIESRLKRYVEKLPASKRETVLKACQPPCTLFKTQFPSASDP